MKGSLAGLWGPIRFTLIGSFILPSTPERDPSVAGSWSPRALHVRGMCRSAEPKAANEGCFPWGRE